MAFKVTLNRKGVGEVLKGDGVEADLLRHGEAIARRAGPGFVTETSKSRTRVRVTVFGTTREAYVAQVRHKALLRAFGSAR